jgi:hypothetical protein
MPALRKAIPALLLFALSLGACEWSFATKRQLGYMGGLADNWFALGLNLRSHSVFGEGAEPTLFKPPGYPLLVAGVLALSPSPEGSSKSSSFGPGSELAGLSLPYAEDGLLRGSRAVFHAHGALLGATAAILYLWLSPFLSFRPAFLAGLVFGTNPYCLVLAGLLNYSVAHLFLLVLSCFVLQKALEANEGGFFLFLVSGVLWGGATLLRPVTLLLPPFALTALALYSPSRRRALRGFFALVLGMSLVILPWTFRNYRLSGRLVPVNAQAWKAIWAGTVKPVAIDTDHFRYKLLRDEAIVLESQVAGEAHRVGWEPLGVRENLALEDRFREAALKNLRHHPRVYLGNAWRSFWTFTTDFNTVLVGLFDYVQGRPNEEIEQKWFAPKTPQPFQPPFPRGSSPGAVLGLLALPSGRIELFFDGLSILALLGLITAPFARARFLIVPGLVLLCLAAAHSVTWMDLMYYYVKVPFVVIFGISFVSLLKGSPSAAVSALGSVLEWTIGVVWLFLAVTHVF